MANVSKTGKDARELYELKQRALAFYRDNGIPEKMENILNSMFYDNPDDVYGHVANYFESFAKKPVISQVRAREVIDSKGQPTIQTEIYTSYKNNEQLTTSCVSSSVNMITDHVPQEERDLEAEERQNFVSEAIRIIREYISDALKGVDPADQENVDTIIFLSTSCLQPCNMIDKLRLEELERLEAEREANGDGEANPVSPGPTVASEKPPAKAKSAGKGKGKGGPPVVVIPDEPREKMLCGCNAISAISQAACLAGATVQNVPLYQHFAALKSKQVPNEYMMPIPMVSILAGGRAYPGKSNCVKEFMVLPKPDMQLRESVKHMVNIYNYIAKTLSVKGGVQGRFVGDTGSLTLLMDKPEQGLDLIQEAITQQGLTPGEDFYLAINAAAHEIFDHEKGKYEVITAVPKSSEDMVEFWSELLGRYPSIIALIDPIRKQEKENWMRLCERVSERCYIMGDFVHHRPGLLKDEELAEDFKTSGIVLKLEQMNSISDVLKVVTKMEEADNQIVLSTSIGETNDTLLADMAVGCGATFLKLGAPCRGERVAKLNRLLQIESDLDAMSKLVSRGALTFPTIKPPTPPPEEEGEEGRQSATGSPKKK